MSADVVTPQMIETRLRQLSKEVDNSYTDLANAEREYFEVKAKYELALAHARLSLIGQSGQKLTVTDKADTALISTKDLHLKMGAAEALVRAARANAQRVRTQVDIARSIGTSVRTSMEL